MCNAEYIRHISLLLNSHIIIFGLHLPCLLYFSLTLKWNLNNSATWADKYNIYKYHLPVFARRVSFFATEIPEKKAPQVSNTVTKVSNFVSISRPQTSNSCWPDKLFCSYHPFADTGEEQQSETRYWCSNNNLSTFSCISHHIKLTQKQSRDFQAQLLHLQPTEYRINYYSSAARAFAIFVLALI